MAKKRAKRKSHKKRKILVAKKTIHKTRAISNANKLLTENFTAFQKIMVKMVTSLDELNKRFAKLLQLFEISAKTLAEKDIDLGKDVKSKKEILEKLDNLLEQNKTIARGLAMIYEHPVHQPAMQMPSPHLAMQMPQNPRPSVVEGYEKSVPISREEPSPIEEQSKFKKLPKIQNA